MEKTKKTRINIRLLSVLLAMIILTVSLLVTGTIALAGLTDYQGNPLNSAIDKQVDAIIAKGKYYVGEARSMLDPINEMRTGKDAWYWNSDNKTKTVLTNVGTLTYDYALEQIAMRRAAELAMSFAHQRPDGTSCFDLYYDGVSSWGENIAYCYGYGDSTMQLIFNGWSETNEKYEGQGHRRNMLNPNFTSIGIGCFVYNGAYYWVQEFGYSYSGISDPIGNFLSTPKLSSVTSASNGITIKWDSVAGAVKYRLYYKTEGENWTKITDTTSTSYTWTGAKYGIKYTFTVRCVDKDGKTFTSSYDSTGKTITLIAAPKLSSVENTAKGVKITWAKSAGAEKYRVYYKTGSGSWTKIADTTSTSYTWTGAKSGTKYTFTVRCLSADGNSFTSSYDTVGKSITYIAAPQISSVAVTATGVQITWGKVTGAAKYRVYYKTGSGSWTKIADTTASSYIWTGAKSGTKYTFTVRCLSADGKSFTSAYDTVGKSITYTATPKISSVSLTATGVQISWGKVTGAELYRVYYKTGSGSWTKIADTTSSSYIWTGAKSGTKYSFTVRCLSADGKSFTSSYDTVGKSITYIAAPKISSATSIATGVQVSWGKVTGASKYRVYYKTGSGSWTKIADTTATSYTWTGAKSGTEYTFTVRCISSDGKSFTSSYDSVGKTVTYIAAPKISSISNATEGVQLVWGKVTGAEKYRVFRKTGSGSWVAIGDTTSTSFVDQTAVKGTKYTYTVRCLSSDGKSYTSGYDSVGKTITR